ncbi:MAG: hypothetical protein U0350_41830 [Caldilineaceae bacterium]
MRTQSWMFLSIGLSVLLLMTPIQSVQGQAAKGNDATIERSEEVQESKLAIAPKRLEDDFAGEDTGGVMPEPAAEDSNHLAYQVFLPVIEERGDGTGEVQAAASGAVLGLDVAGSRPDVAWNQFCNKFLVVYESDEGGGNYNIWGRYVTGDGLMLGAGPFRLTTDGAQQRAPAIAYNPMGHNYLVVWQDNRNNGDWEIYAQLWNCEKMAVNAAVRVTADAASQLYPDVSCGYTARVCWVVWEDQQNIHWDIYGQVLNFGGALVGGNVRLTVDGATQRAPAIAYNPENTGCASQGSFFVVWEDNRNANSGFDVYGQQLDNASLCFGNQLIYTATQDQGAPDIAYGTVNHLYQVVWQDVRGGNLDISARVMTANGFIGPPSVVLANAVNTQARPAVAYAVNFNEFRTVWQDFRTGNWDIYGYRTTGNGAPVAGGMVVGNPSAEQSPAIAFSPTSAHSFVAWAKDTAGIQGRAIWP